MSRSGKRIPLNWAWGVIHGRKDERAACVPEADQAFANDKFILNQKRLAIGDKYTVSDQKGDHLMYVERPRYVLLDALAVLGGIVLGILNYICFAPLADAWGSEVPEGVGLALVTTASILIMAISVLLFLKKRNITVYRDESRAEILLHILQGGKRPLFTGSFTVADPKGNTLARLTCKSVRNLLVKSWDCHDKSGRLLFTAGENSIIRSVSRRLAGGSLGLLHASLLFYGPDGNILGKLKRKKTVLDRKSSYDNFVAWGATNRKKAVLESYVLDMSADRLHSVDRRAALAMAAIFDVGEK